MSKGKWSKVLFWFIVAVLVAVIVWCLWQIGYKLVTDAQDKSLYDDLAASKNAVAGTRPTDYTYSVPASGEGDHGDFTEPEGNTGNSSDTTVEVPEGIIKECAGMYALNNDTVGWITIPGTSIDYPVVQSPYQTNFYLRRDIYKQKATCGTIFVREKCDVFAPSDNVTIYGHNMADGSMFACLHNYINKAAWDNNSLIFFDTLYEYHTYKIFAVFKTSANIGQGFSYHQFVDAANETEFNDFVSKCKELSFYDTGITPVYGDKIICLSTCEYTLTNGRLVVAAVRIS